MSLQQPSKVYISNRYSLQGQPASSFDNMMQMPIERPIAFKVESASVDYTWSTFSKYDNMIYLQIGQNSYTIEISTSKYYENPVDLAADIQALLRSATSLDFNFTYNTLLSQRFQMSPPSGTTFSFNAGPFSAYERLGFWEATGTYSNASPLLGDHMMDMQRTHSAWIVSDISNGTYSSNGRTDIICRVPVTSEFGSVLRYSDNGNVFLPISATYISSMSFQILDDDGNELDTNHVSIELAFQYAPESDMIM